LITTNKVHFQYGMLEFKVKAPWGVGIWSGLWTTGTGQGWPWGGEIDMFEFVGGGGRDDHWPVCMHFCAPNTPSADAWSGNKHISGNLNVHYGSESSKEYKDLYLKPGQTKLADDWHIIGIEWTNKEMIFYIDGIRFKSVDITGDEASFAYHNPHQIHLQMSCDTGGWAGDANGNPELAAGRMQVMEIDWVKVWQSDEIPGSKFPVGSNK